MAELMGPILKNLRTTFSNPQIVKCDECAIFQSIINNIFIVNPNPLDLNDHYTYYLIIEQRVLIKKC